MARATERRGMGRDSEQLRQRSARHRSMKAALQRMAFDYRRRDKLDFTGERRTTQNASRGELEREPTVHAFL